LTSYFSYETGRCVMMALNSQRIYGDTLYSIRHVEKQGQTTTELLFPNMPFGIAVVFRTWLDRNLVQHDLLGKLYDIKVSNLRQQTQLLDDIAINLALFRVDQEESSIIGKSPPKHEYFIGIIYIYL
jgi:hypothetical protein